MSPKTPYEQHFDDMRQRMIKTTATERVVDAAIAETKAELRVRAAKDAGVDWFEWAEAKAALATASMNRAKAVKTLIAIIEEPIDCDE